jgi:hypothetical protein
MSRARTGGDTRHPAPELDPYFIPDGRGPKGDPKSAPLSDEEIRRDLLPTEASFRVAGTMGMVLGASVFVVFAVPVSGMLHGAGEPGGVLLEADWLWRRWVARMASVLTLAVVGTITGWGLSRLRPWARWALIVLGAVPPLSLAAGLGLRARVAGPGVRELSDLPGLACVAMLVVLASMAAYRAACSRHGRAVLARDYRGLVERTPKLSTTWTAGLRNGAGLALAMFILYWTLLLTLLGVLAACGVIRSI